MLIYLLSLLHFLVTVDTYLYIYTSNFFVGRS